MRFYLNEPNGKAWTHFQKMIPSLGSKYEIDLEVISKPREEFKTEEYINSGEPKAPAIYVGGEKITEGKDVDDHTVESAICRQLGLEPPPLD